MNFTVYQDPATVLNVSETCDILIEHAEETAIEAELGPSAFFLVVSSNICILLKTKVCHLEKSN